MIASDKTEPIPNEEVLLFSSKNGINFTELRKPADDMECQAVSIKTSAGSITVINVYIPREMISAVRL